MRLKLQVPLPDALFRAFGISSRGGFQPELAESVQPVVIIDPNAGAAGASTHASGDESVIASQSFVGFNTRGAGGAGTFARLQLALGFDNAGNPVTTGKTALVDKVSLFSTGGTTLFLGFDTAGIQAFGGNGPWSKKNTGGGSLAGSVMQVRNGSPVLLLANRSMAFLLVANTTLIVEFREPFLMQDGDIFAAHCNNANQDLTATFEWREVPKL